MSKQDDGHKRRGDSWPPQPGTERYERWISFAWGNAAVDCPQVTRETVERIAAEKYLRAVRAVAEALPQHRPAVVQQLFAEGM